MSKKTDKLIAEHTESEELLRLRRERKAVLKHAARLEARYKATEKIRQQCSVRAPVARKGRVLSGDRRYATAVAMLSDCHIEERVDPRKVQGLNEYNPTIAEARMARFFAGVEWLIKEQQGMFRVTNLLTVLGGDTISGHIHRELLEQNYMSPVEAVVFGQRIIADGFATLLKNTDLKIHVVCKCGNHGRTTDKIVIGSYTESSFEWLLYTYLAAAFRNEPRITWQIDEGVHSITELYDKRIHTHHGDSVRSNGGIGGIEVPLNRAALQWRTKYKADYSMVGHFHQLIQGERLTVNGSLIGYSTYADWLASASPEDARQAFMLWDSARGPCQKTGIWVQK